MLYDGKAASEEILRERFYPLYWWMSSFACIIPAFAHITYMCKHVNFRASRCDGGAKGASGASSALRASVFIRPKAINKP